MKTVGYVFNIYGTNYEADKRGLIKKILGGNKRLPKTKISEKYNQFGIEKSRIEGEKREVNSENVESIDFYNDDTLIF